MEKDFESCFPNQHCDWNLPNLNSGVSQLDLGRKSISTEMIPGSDAVPMNRSSPVFGCSGSQMAFTRQSRDAHKLLYPFPNLLGTLDPVLTLGSKEKLPAIVNENYDEVKGPTGGYGCSQRRFLVFDHCSDKTSLIFTSGLGTPIPCSTSWAKKVSCGFELNKDATNTKDITVFHSEPHMTVEYNEIYGSDIASEMHEDTEELNALLYSDSDNDYSDNDEEASTGHSPSTMISYGKQECSVESGEEVASSVVPSKRKKPSDEVDNKPLFENTAKSMKSNNCFDQDDAESSCGNDNYHVMEEFSSASSKKRARTEKIRETVNILRSIIPSGMGKDTIGVLDEAIHYLKSIRPMADAIGFNVL